MTPAYPAVGRSCSSIPLPQGSLVKACWRPVVPTATGSVTSSPRVRSSTDDRIEIVVDQGEVLAHVGWCRQLDEVHLLPVDRVEPGAGESEVRSGEVLGEAERLGVERDGARHVGDVQGHVVHSRRRHGVAHGSEPTT